MPSESDSPSCHRALVALDSTPRDLPVQPTARRTATFLAQLIATACHLPQARERRRADPADVIAAYRATIEKLHALNARPR